MSYSIRIYIRIGKRNKSYTAKITIFLTDIKIFKLMTFVGSCDKLSEKTFRASSRFERERNVNAHRCVLSTFF